MDIFIIAFNYFVVLYPAIIFWDASHHKIGKIESEKKAFNFSAAGWATASLFPFVWWVAVPAYLFKRNSLIAKAKINPQVEPLEFKIVVTILLIVFKFALTYQFSIYPSTSEEDYQTKKSLFWQGLGVSGE